MLHVGQIRKLAAMTTAALIAAAEALAQEKAVRPARRILVSIPDRKLVLMQEDRVLKIYDTAVGAPKSPSPVGSFQVINHVADPTWFHKGRTVPPGKSNPLGTRWIGLSRKGYGIHGTNNPGSIGRNASHGCIRMRNRDVEELFELVSVGDSVDLLSQRNEELDRVFGVTLAQAGNNAAAAVSPE